MVTSVNSHKRRSESPPPIQNISKRAKRHNALVERFTELTDKFTENREEEYRAQILSHQRDINFVIEAKTYTAEPLDDFGIDIIAATCSKERRSSLIGGQGLELEAHPTAGRWSAKFVQEVNDTMEQRDVQLTVLCVSIPPLDALSCFVFPRNSTYQYTLCLDKKLIFPYAGQLPH